MSQNCPNPSDCARQFGNISASLENIKELLNEARNDIKEIKIQTIKTNGRVNKLEEHYQDLSEKVHNNNKELSVIRYEKAYQKGILFAVAIGGGIIIKIIELLWKMFV